MRARGTISRTPARRPVPTPSDLWSALFTGALLAAIAMAVVSGWSEWAVAQFGPPGEHVPLAALHLVAFVGVAALGWRSGRRGGPVFPTVARVLHVLHHDRGGVELARSVRRLASVGAIGMAVIASAAAVAVGSLVPDVGLGGRVAAAVGGALGAVGIFCLAARASVTIPGSDRRRPMVMFVIGCSSVLCGLSAAATGGVPVPVVSALLAVAFPLCLSVWEEGAAVDLGVVLERSEAMSVAGVALVHRDVRSLVRTSEFGPGSNPTSAPSPRVAVRSVIATRWLWSYSRRSPQLVARHLLAVAVSVCLAWTTAVWPPAGVALVPALWWLAVLTIEPLAVELELHALSRTLIRRRSDIVHRAVVALIACGVVIAPAFTVLLAVGDLPSFDEVGPGARVALLASSLLLGSLCALAGAVRTVTSHTDDLLAELMAAQPEAYGLAIAISEAIPFLLVGAALAPAALAFEGTVVSVAGYLRISTIIGVGVAAWTFVRLHRCLDPTRPTLRDRVRVWR